MATEWYRRTSWGAAEEADFDRRLARSRAHNRSQYLRIQATHLVEARPPLYDAALGLLSRLVDEYLDRTQLAQAHLQRAECLIALGREHEAIGAFRAALEAEREFPNSRTVAYLRFAYFIATTGRTDCFDEVLGVLKEFGSGEVFPYERFLHNAALALIADGWGEGVAAREPARRALQAAEQSRSGFRYHPTFGLVEGADAGVVRRLRVLAAG